MSTPVASKQHRSLILKKCRAFEVTSFCSCGFVKFCIRFSHKFTRFRYVKRIRMRIPLNRFAVRCAFCFQRALTVIKVCLLLPFLLKKSSLNSILAFKTSKSFIQLDGHKDFTRIGHLSVCTNLWSFSGDPYPVWWWLFLVYETWCFSKWHHFIAFWMGFPHMIVLHEFKTVYCYGVTNQNIPNFFCYVYLQFQRKQPFDIFFSVCYRLTLTSPWAFECVIV